MTAETGKRITYKMTLALTRLVVYLLTVYACGYAGNMAHPELGQELSFGDALRAHTDLSNTHHRSMGGDGCC